MELFFQCLGVTWYLACDMQMYWGAPLVILPLWWNRKVGVVLWGLQMAGWTALQAYLTDHYNLGPLSDLQ